MNDFNAVATGFDAVNAFWLGRCADLAYQDEPAVRAALAQWGMRAAWVSVCDLPHCDTQALVAASPKALIVAFRGTKDVLDFVTDAQFLQSPFPCKGGFRGKVHTGFLRGLDGAWTSVRGEIEVLRDASQPVWLAGHSLGGALATLAAARLADEGIEVRGVYTAGSPTVGDPEFAEWFDRTLKGRVFRYVNDLDLVARCPPEDAPLLPPYRHVGRRMHFGADGALTEESDYLRWASVAAAMFEIWRRSRTGAMTREQLKEEIRRHAGEPLADHAMAGYVRNLEAARSRRSAEARTSPGLAASLESAFGRLRAHWFK